MSPSLGPLFSAALVLASGIAATHTSSLTESRARPASNVTNIITRDVVIVGGGASGAHAAVRLRDMGKTVVVVERRSQLVSLGASSTSEPLTLRSFPFTRGKIFRKRKNQV